MVIGCFAPGMRRGWPVVFASGCVLGVHAALWKLGAFGSAGYPRYFVTLAPAFAVLITGGVEVLARVLKPVPRLVWPLAMSLLAVFLIGRHPTAAVRPPLPPDARLFAELGKWIRTQDPSPVLFSAHPFAYLELPTVPPDRFEDFGTIRAATLDAAPSSSWVLVEDRFYLTRPQGVQNGEPASRNPTDADLRQLGFEEVAVPNLGITLAVEDARHDPAIGGMRWALWRKAR
jgi:hypothetical protein